MSDLTGDLALLPGNATPLEKAVSLAGAARRPLPADLVRAVWNADTCPADLLGWLARALSVDIWDEVWPEAKKRAVIKRALPLHAIKGTEAALCEYLDLAGFPAVDVVVPPQAFFLAEDPTPEQYEAWFQSLPEIRLYRLKRGGGPENFLSAAPLAGESEAEASLVAEGMFLNDGADQGFLGFCLPDPLNLADATRREAVLIEDGVTTKLGLDGEDAIRELPVERFYIPRRNGGSLMLAEAGAEGGGYLDDACLVGAGERFDDVVSVRRSGALAWWNLTHHGREPVSATPRKIAEDVPDAGGFYLGKGYLDGGYLTPEDNGRHRYESWRLAARGRVPELPAAVSFLDYSRLGIDPDTAEVVIDTRRRIGGLSFVGDFITGGHDGIFLSEADAHALAPALRAVNAARGAIDRVLIDPVTERPPTISTAIALNDLSLR